MCYTEKWKQRKELLNFHNKPLKSYVCRSVKNKFGILSLRLKGEKKPEELPKGDSLGENPFVF